MCIEGISIIRRRIIPKEDVLLRGDELLLEMRGERNILVTRWLPIKPRNDIGWGFSVYMLDEHYKASAMYDVYGNFYQWYCDIIKYDYSNENKCYTVVDLLVDVVKTSDGKIKIIDEEELIEAQKQGMIQKEDFNLAIGTARIVAGKMKNESFMPLYGLFDNIEPPVGFHPKIPVHKP